MWTIHMEILMQRYTNCIVPDGGYTTCEGYIRVLQKSRKLGGKLKMLHRVEWEKSNGLIEEGYEIHHKCKNRVCSNINHLEVLSKIEHSVETNKSRYKYLEDDVVAFYMKNPSLNQIEIGKVFGIDRRRVGRMIKRRVTRTPNH